MHTYQELDLGVPEELVALKENVHSFAKDVSGPLLLSWTGWLTRVT